jgi:hypothetical protein
MVVVPGHYLNFQPWALIIETKEAELRAREHEFTEALSRLDGLEVSDASRAMFQRFVNGQMTIKELNTAIDKYLNLKPRSAG